MKTINVRQGQWAFRGPKSPYKQLVSRNFGLCVGVAGIHKEDTFGFITHFDLPWTPSAIRTLWSEMLVLDNNLRPKDFTITVYGGICIWPVTTVVALVALAAPIPIHAKIVSGTAFFLFGLLCRLTSIVTLKVLKQQGFSIQQPVKTGSWYRFFPHLLYEVRVPPREQPETVGERRTPATVAWQLQVPNKKDDKFTRLRAGKAEGSD